MHNINLYITDEHTSTGYREATLEEIMTCARHALRARVRKGTILGSPRMTAHFLIGRLAEHQHEVFTLIYLDKRHRMIACQDLFRGTIDVASVHPREVVKDALKHNAAAVILAHNRPSGVAEPSQADEQITRRLKAALDLVDIRVLDHVVVAGGDTMSFAEKGNLVVWPGPPCCLLSGHRSPTKIHRVWRLCHPNRIVRAAIIK